MRQTKWEAEREKEIERGNMVRERKRERGGEREREWGGRDREKGKMEKIMKQL